MEIQLVSNPLTARGAEEPGICRPVGEAVQDVGEADLGETEVAVPRLLLHTELDVAPLQGQKWDVEINQTGANHGALV